MLSWFSGGADKTPSTAARTPGFHPIVLPTPNTTQAHACTTSTDTAASASPRQAIAPAEPAPVASTATGAEAPVTRISETANSEEALASAASSSFLFSGMEVGKGRRRRPQVSPQRTRSIPSQVEKTRLDADPAAVGHTRQQDCSTQPASSPADLRQRLESFYRLYNPAKLAQVEAILVAYRGREADLFQDLVRRYGPEPVGLSVAHLSELLPYKSQRPGSAPSESEVSAFRFISATAETGAEATAWAAAPITEEAPPVTPSVSASRKGANANVAMQPALSAVQLPSSSQSRETPTEVVPESQAPTTTPSSPSPAVGNPEQPLRQPQRSSTDAPPAPPSLSSSPDEEEEEPMDERHRRELRISQGTLLEARAALAALLREAQSALEQRQDMMTRIHTMEIKIREHVREENYREADAVSETVAHTACGVLKCDELWSALGRRIAAAQRQLEEAVRGVASLLRVHEVELQNDEEKGQRRVHSQLHHDESDLRQCEDTVRARKEALTIKRSAAETRLQAARAGEAEVQRRVDAALGAMRTQKESLSNEVDGLDRLLDDLRAQIRQLEGKRAAAYAQLSKVADELQTAEATHAGELDAAAVSVDSCEGEVERINQRRSEVEAEEANIAAECAAREAAAAELLKELRARQDEREAVHRRTRALEQDTIPASDRYWKSWQDLLAVRLRGADVLFELPATARPAENAKGGSSASSTKADLLKQLDKLTGELEANEELRRDAQRRLEVSEARVAPLMAAKSAAVGSKNFKAAQQCADDLKVVQLSIKACQDDVELYDQQVQALGRTMKRVRSELASVEAEMRRYAADFKRDYGAAVDAFDEAVAHTPDYAQLPAESQGPDELEEAVRGLWGALRLEWLRAREDNAPASEPEQAEVAATVTPSTSPSLPPVGSTTEGATADLEPNAASKDLVLPSEEEVRRRLDELQTCLEEAMAREAYGECDSIQQRILQLEAQLALAAPPP
ncbi:hypothetical protein ABL78_1827 [Leptomonas seymouri]|uniref:Uncharacterized protein n=1 Tax=Leptomonas seymouri TaxID=5684 RepID=A0A0N1PFQ0_LEPSE|nr:hypothetical protein ABL78_1827 [Leptomonas seymouri]|eukprot:KPI89091.1 hypothetical protein ABL78_1827 [Leptomonas seymouri]